MTISNEIEKDSEKIDIGDMNSRQFKKSLNTLLGCPV